MKTSTLGSVVLIGLFAITCGCNSGSDSGSEDASSDAARDSMSFLPDTQPAINDLKRAKDGVVELFNSGRRGKNQTKRTRNSDLLDDRSTPDAGSSEDGFVEDELGEIEGRLGRDSDR